MVQADGDAALDCLALSRRVKANHRIVESLIEPQPRGGQLPNLSGSVAVKKARSTTTLSTFSAWRKDIAAIIDYLQLLQAAPQP